jgi:hypothetical protein
MSSDPEYPPVNVMPAEPGHTPMGERLRERTDQVQPDDPQYGYAHAHLTEAMGRPLRRLQQVYDPPGDIAPLAPLFDPELCPDWALPWLAQTVGVTLPPGTPDAAARTIITSVGGQARGTPAALRAAAGIFLTGTKTVFFRERDPDSPDPPYYLEVVTLTQETPDPALVLRALLAQKPGGIVLTYLQIESWDYQEQTLEAASSGWAYTTLPTVFASYADLAANQRTS